MKRLQFPCVLSAALSMGLLGCSVHESEDEFDAEYAAASDESADDGEPLVASQRPDGLGVVVPAPSSAELPWEICPGGCDDPPPCHGPGVCFADPMGGSSCFYPHAPVGTSCDPGNQCMVGECYGGSCNAWPAAPGTTCDDGDPGTAPDTCDGAGNCDGLPTCPDGCTNPPPCHVGPGHCVVVPELGEASCIYVEMFNGMGCDDGFECTFSECVGGSCVTTWYLSEGTACDDGDPNTANDVCDDAGTCEGELTCPGGCTDPPPCKMGPGSCQLDPFSGEPTCVYANAFNGSVCDDGFECTFSECVGGTCVTAWSSPAGTSCNDGNRCTTNDSCDEFGNCRGVPRWWCGGFDEPLEPL